MVDFYYHNLFLYHFASMLYPVAKCHSQLTWEISCLITSSFNKGFVYYQRIENEKIISQRCRDKWSQWPKGARVSKNNKSSDIFSMRLKGVLRKIQKISVLILIFDISRLFGKVLSNVTLNEPLSWPLIKNCLEGKVQ